MIGREEVIMVKIEIEDAGKAHEWGPGMAFLDMDGDLNIITDKGVVLCISGACGESTETQVWVWPEASDAMELQEERGCSLLFPVSELKITVPAWAVRKEPVSEQPIGVCSLCGGQVVGHRGVWHGIIPPPPAYCTSCGAVEAGGPVIPMVGPTMPAAPPIHWNSGTGGVENTTGGTP